MSIPVFKIVNPGVPNPFPIFKSRNVIMLEYIERILKLFNMFQNTRPLLLKNFVSFAKYFWKKLNLIKHSLVFFWLFRFFLDWTILDIQIAFNVSNCYFLLNDILKKLYLHSQWRKKCCEKVFRFFTSWKCASQILCVFTNLFVWKIPIPIFYRAFRLFFRQKQV